MSDNPEKPNQKRGRDTTYRTNNLDTHLTHGCIQLFRQFSRVRPECAGSAGWRSLTIAPFSGSAPRTLGEAVS
jgi:hypothetical protein